MQGKTDKYMPANIKAAIQQYWERQREGTILKFVKPKATRSAFTTSITFDGEEATDIGDSTVVPTTITKKSKLFDTNTKSRNKKKKNNHQAGHCNRSRSPIPKIRTHLRRANQTEKRDVKQSHETCSAYGGVSHSFIRCYLVLGQDKD